MDSQARVINLLLRTYPSRWRSEYGDELAHTLACRSLTIPVIADVVRSGFFQRLRKIDSWILSGIAIAVWLVLGTVANSLAPFSNEGRSHFFQCIWLFETALGYASVSHKTKSIRSAIWIVCKASLIGISPEILLAALWAAGVVHPTILDMHGAAFIRGRGIVDVCVTSEVRGFSPLHLLLTVPASFISALLAGTVGAAVAKAVAALRKSLHVTQA